VLSAGKGKNKSNLDPAESITLPRTDRMNILLIAATAREIEPFFEYYRTSKRSQDIDILITGIGLTTATYHLLKQITLKRPDLIIQAGVAGCFTKKIPLGTVVLVQKETIADQSVIELKKLKTLFDLELVPHDQFPFKKGWLENTNDLLNKSKLKKVTAISVNEITTSKARVKFYKHAFKPEVESMEGAALHYTGLMEKVPFLQMRGISNYIAERDKKKWEMKKSIANLNGELIKLAELIGL
jgi:futalosine hydrolase